MEARIVGNLGQFPRLQEAANIAGSHSDFFTASRRLLEYFDRFSAAPDVFKGELSWVAIALQATIDRMTSDPSLTQYVANEPLTSGFETDRGFVDPDFHFLAVVETGHFLWCRSHNKMTQFYDNELADFVQMPESFLGNFSDVINAVVLLM